MKSYNGDATLKKDLVSEMKHHQKLDAFTKGTYAKQNGIFKGCAVGCSVQSLITKRGVTIKHNNHAALAEYVGMPEWLMRLQDTLFEGLPLDESKTFPVEFWKAIPVGVNLEPVKWKFCAYLMKENIERVLALKDIDDALKEQVVSAIRGVLSLHEKAIETGKWGESWSASESARSASESARSASESAWLASRSAWLASKAARSAWLASESAARSASWSARSAWLASRSAWLASESAARSASWSATLASESAAYSRHAKELLRLLKVAK